MKNEPKIKKNLTKEQKDLIAFLQDKGYNQIFNLGRAFVTLEYVTCGIPLEYHHRGALKITFLEDPAMAERPPFAIWRNRQEVYIAGNKMGLGGIATMYHCYAIVDKATDKFGQTVEKHVLLGKSTEEWRAEANEFIHSLTPILRGNMGGKEEKPWKERFRRIENRLETLLREYDKTVAGLRDAENKIDAEIPPAAMRICEDPGIISNKRYLRHVLDSAQGFKYLAVIRVHAVHYVVPVNAISRRLKTGDSKLIKYYRVAELEKRLKSE